MTAVPPPVPPEIVERVAAVIAKCVLGSAADLDERQWEFWRNVAEIATAAVYGDIVEAARRDALDAAIDAIRALDNSDDPWIRQGARTAARIVTGLRDATAPRTAPAASVSDEGTR